MTPLVPEGPFLPVVTGSQAATFDAEAQARGIPGAVLMESAGRAAADVAEVLLRSESSGPASSVGRPVVVVTGAGNNGGDAVVLARTLHVRGWAVRLLVDPRRPDPDPLLHGHALEPVSLAGPDPHSRDPAPRLVVDGLLGTGLTSSPRDPLAGWIRELCRTAAAAGCPVLSLDLPSGVIADTGEVPGEAVEADLTVAFGALKLGTLLHPGRARAGRQAVVDIGFPPWTPADASAGLITAEWARTVLPRRPLDTHKNAVGRLLLVAGGETMGGAAILAARAALRTGVGMLRILCHPSHRTLFHHHLPEALLPDPGDAEAVTQALRASDAVAAGPGMGTDPNHVLPRVLVQLMEGAGDAPVPFLFDADALTLLARGHLPPLPPGHHLLTPHPGEWARLAVGTGADPASGSHDHASPLAAASKVARRWGAACLLKGAPSVVVSPSSDAGSAWVSSSGGSAFARGGMGDVLTGTAGALMARGLAATDAAALALHLTGEAARLAEGALGSGDALLPSDVACRIGAAIAVTGDANRAATGGATGAATGAHALHEVPAVRLVLEPPS